MLALRSSADPSVPIGRRGCPKPRATSQVSGSIVVLVIVTLAVVGYLFLAGKPAAARLTLIAVIGGIACGCSKFAFGRARPGVGFLSRRLFTSSFPSAHATRGRYHLSDDRRRFGAEPNLNRRIQHLLHGARGVSYRARWRQPGTVLQLIIG